jgi:hypothetical protein
LLLPLSALLLSIFYRRYLLLLLFFPLALIFTIILIYVESWQIVFSSSSVIRKVFFVKVGHYSYSSLNDACLLYSLTDHEYVVLSFANNKCIRFRMKDENASKALKVIRSHKSVRRKI